jgi:hypothetical protein
VNTTLQRLLLGYLALTGGVTGVWAYAAPRHWYDTFPGLGLRWLPPLGPYNEHFAMDVGAFYLGLTVLSVLTIVCIANTTLVKVAACAWTMFNALHLILHLQMLHMYTPRDQVLNVIVLSSVLLASLVLFVPRRHRSPDISPRARAKSL